MTATSIFATVLATGTALGVGVITDPATGHHDDVERRIEALLLDTDVQHEFRQVSGPQIPLECPRDDDVYDPGSTLDGGGVSLREYGPADTADRASCRSLFASFYGLKHADQRSFDAEMAVSWVAAAASPETAGELVVFQGGARAPWEIFVGDEGNWAVSVSGGASASVNGVVSLIADEQDGRGAALKVTWSGKGEGQYFLAAGTPQDLSDYLDSGSALMVEIMIERPPTKKVTMRMDCQYPCGAKADLTDFMRKVPSGRWIPLSIDLECFADAGADFSRIDSPFLLLTKGKLTLSTADIRIVPEAGADALIRCR